MKTDFKMTQKEMDSILKINKEGGDPVMYLSGGIPIGRSLQEKIDDYWVLLGSKYRFHPSTVEPNDKGELHFKAETT